MLTVADVAPLHTLLERLTPGDPLCSGALTCIPLYAPPRTSPTGRS
jgi:hypothetical protein